MWIDIVSSDFGKGFRKEGVYERWAYHVYVATAEYAGSTGLCTKNNGVYKAPSFKKNKQVTDAVAKKACAALKGTNQFDNCVMDAKLLDEQKLLKDIVKGSKEANKAEKKLDEDIKKNTKKKRPNGKKKTTTKTPSAVYDKQNDCWCHD